MFAKDLILSKNFENIVTAMITFLVTKVLVKSKLHIYALKHPTVKSFSCYMKKNIPYMQKMPRHFIICEKLIFQKSFPRRKTSRKCDGIVLRKHHVYASRSKRNDLRKKSIVNLQKKRWFF